MVNFFLTLIKKILTAGKWYLILVISAGLGGIISRTINSPEIGILFTLIFMYLGYRYMKKIKVKKNSLNEVKSLLNSNSLISDELISKSQIKKSSSLFNQIKIHNEKVLEYQKELEKQREIEEEKERKREERRYNSLIKKYGEEMVKKSYDEEVFLNQPEELLIIAMGEPEDVKESVTKDKVRKTFFYIPYQTHLKTTNYRYSVTLENKIVVGYKDLN